jgi:hypothetical protein
MGLLGENRTGGENQNMIAELSMNPYFGMLLGTVGMICIVSVAFWIITRP